MKPTTVGIPVLLGATVYLLATVVRWGTTNPPTPPSAIAKFPQIIDLGAREIGDVAIGRFSLANVGACGLVVDKIRTNCSCAGLEREANGEFTRVDHLQIPPGETI